MIELKLDGHVIYRLDVVTHYQEQIKRHQVDMREQMTVAANLRDDRDILIRERDALKDAAQFALETLNMRMRCSKECPCSDCLAITALKAVLK